MDADKTLEAKWWPRAQIDPLVEALGAAAFEGGEDEAGIVPSDPAMRSAARQLDCLPLSPIIWLIGKTGSCATRAEYAVISGGGRWVFT